MAHVPWHESMLSTQDVADRIGVSQRRVQQFTKKAIELKMAARVGRAVVFHVRAVKWIRKRTGRKPSGKN